MAEQVEISDLANFTKAIDGMIVKNEKSWKDTLSYYESWYHFKEYTREEVEKIISSGAVEGARKLSRVFFRKDNLDKIEEEVTRYLVNC